MFKKFSHKLIFCFFVLTFIIIIPLTFFLSQQINKVITIHLETSLEVAKNIFIQHNNAKRKYFADSTESVSQTHPQIRALLGSTTSEDNLFDDNNQKIDYKDLNLRLKSIVEDLPLFKESDLFVIADSKGTVLYNKLLPQRYSQSIISRKEIQEALNGQPINTWFRSTEKSLIDQGLLKNWKSKLYDIFIQPVKFQGHGVVGLMIVGHAIDQERIASLEKISQSRIILFDNQDAFTNFPKKLLKIVRSQDKSTFIFKKNSQNYIAHKKILHRPDTYLLLFKSIDEESSRYETILKFLYFLSFVATVFAIIFSFFIGKSVSKAIGILIHGVKKVKEGNLDLKIEVPGKDEFSSLANALNEMVRGLRDKESLTRIFKKYVDVQVADTILQKIDDIELGGTTEKVVVYFSDIKDFTSISENLSPQEVVSFLNIYLSYMSEKISKAGGIIDNYIGDAIIAYWKEDDHDIEKIVKLIIDQRRGLADLQIKLKEFPIPPIDYRVGLHLGDVIVGNIGSNERMNHTVIGDSVNTASRLEMLNKVYNTHVLLSESIYSQISSKFFCRKIDFLRVKGKNLPIEIYELLDQEENKEDLKNSFELALNNYLKGDFEKAFESFLAHKKRFPSDLAIIPFLERCQYYIKNPPKNWDGVYSMTTK